MRMYKKMVFLLALVSLLFSCSRSGTPVSETPVSEMPPAEEDTAELVEEEELSPVEAPRYEQAIITFISGDVYIRNSDEWIYAEIGQLLESKDALKVAAGGYCEIQFGDRAVIRLEEDTELALNTIGLEPGKARVGLELVQGSVISRVMKLSSDERYSVKTQSVVCGVRGTEFRVKQVQGADTVLAVQEGTVAVLPPELDIDTLIERSGAKAESVAVVLKNIESSASVVAGNEEISLNRESFAEVKEPVEEIVRILETAAAAEKAAAGEDTVEMSESVLLDLSAAAEKVSVISREKPVQPVPISSENSDALKQTEEMRMIAIPAAMKTAEGPETGTAPETDGTGGAAKEARPPALQFYKLSLKVIPDDARIILNGRQVGRGLFSGIFPEGEELTIAIEREGYGTQRISYTISEATAKQYTYELKKLDRDSGTAPKTDAAAGPEEPAAAAAPAGADESGRSSPEPEDEKPSAEQPSAEVQTVAMTEAPEEEELIDIRIQVRPADASLMVNGERAAGGEYAGSFPEGTTLQVEGRRRGFSTESMAVNVRAGGSRVYTLNLEARPIESVLSVSDRELIGSIAAGGRFFYTSDAAGTVYATTPDGRLAWKVPTGNSSVQNSFPVYAGNRVYFTGPRELVIIDAGDGSIVTRRNLDSRSAHLFGRYVVAYGGQRLLPANNEIIVLDSNGNVLRSIGLEDTGSRMTPAVWKNKILTVDQNGTFLIIDAASGEVETSISTSGIQPIALSITIQDNLALFSGRKGDVVCINLETAGIEWETRLSSSRVQVYSDIVCSRSGAYVYAEGSVYSLDLRDGSPLFDPLNHITAPPAVIGRTLVCGSGDNRLLLIDPSNGRTMKSLAIRGTVSTRPVELNGMIAVGTSEGKLIVINPDGIE
ncbi:MAG: PQQ-binding-like beta-propeller repeat protein [Sediminispirochaetaceae bacterium]